MVAGTTGQTVEQGHQGLGSVSEGGTRPMAVPYLISLFACYSGHIHDGRDVRRGEQAKGKGWEKG